MPVDPYEPIKTTYMQRKLQKLQEEHLAEFRGQSLGAGKPKMSRLERERVQFKTLKAIEKEKKKNESSEWMEKSLSEIFQNVLPRKSKLEQEK